MRGVRAALQLAAGWLLLAGFSTASADPEPIFGLAGRVFNAMFSGEHNKEPKDKEPTDQYGAPSDSYGAPVDSYGAPACACRRTFGNKDKDKDNKDKDKEPCDCYGAPVSDYAAPSYEYSEPCRPSYENRRTFNIFAIFSGGGDKENDKDKDKDKAPCYEDSYGPPSYDPPSYQALSYEPVKHFLIFR